MYPLFNSLWSDLCLMTNSSQVLFVHWQELLSIFEDFCSSTFQICMWWMGSGLECLLHLQITRRKCCIATIQLKLACSLLELRSSHRFSCEDSNNKDEEGETCEIIINKWKKGKDRGGFFEQRENMMKDRYSLKLGTIGVCRVLPLKSWWRSNARRSGWAMQERKGFF